MKCISRTSFLLMSIVCSSFDNACAQVKRVYLLPGQGADWALFSKLHLVNCDTFILHYPVPLKNETMQQYAKRLSTQIDTTKPFCLIGVSFGGMNAVEMAKFLKPEKVILVSSAKTRSELPLRYKFQRYIPLYAIFSGRFYKRMAQLARPIAEPDSKPYDSLFRAMIERKNPLFMKRSIKMICKWKNKEVNPAIVHLHGTNDHTLPIKKIRNAKKVQQGSHMMVYTKANEINALLNAVLE